MKHRVRSVFSRIFLVLLLSFGIYAIAAFLVIVFAAVKPVALTSADDLASLMLMSAETWTQQSAVNKAAYGQRLWESNKLWITADRPEIEEDNTYFLPYLSLIESALAQRTGNTFIFSSDLREGARWFWLDIEVNHEALRIGFRRDRLGTTPLQGLMAVIALALVLMLFTATVLAHRATRPLKQMAAALDDVGHGRVPQRVPETDAAELNIFVKIINDLGVQVRELLDNRTTLLGGISHDLRTPLTRMRLSIEMLEDQCTSKLTAQMKRDIAQMNDMITESMELCRTLEQIEAEETNIAVEIEQVLGLFSVEGERLNWQPGPPCLCSLNAPALRRIILNIVENALRYGDDQMVDISLSCVGPQRYIEVADRGAGIPEVSRQAIFRPFHRLEVSRNTQTGGSGLGLAIAYQLALANKCRIEVSDRVGGGTVFRIMLPE